MSPSPLVEVVTELTSRGYNADREAVTLLARSADPANAISRVLESTAEDVLTLSADDVRAAVDTTPDRPHPSADGASVEPAVETATDTPTDGETAADGSGAASIGDSDAAPTPDAASTADDTTSLGPETTAIGQVDQTEPTNPSVSGGDIGASDAHQTGSPAETKGSGSGEAATSRGRSQSRAVAERSLEIGNDMTGRSTGTGEYTDFVRVFRDRYERLSRLLRPRVKHRPAEAVRSMPGGAEVALVGMISDIRSTKNGHRLVELEDTTGTFPCLFVTGKDVTEAVDELLYDEVVAIEGTLSEDAGICFVDELYFPDVPRTHSPSRADRHVRAALVSDVHAGSQEFRGDAWSRFADWLHSDDAERVEYLLIAGDMVEGIGVYPDQDEELDVVDVYEQYELFAEYLKEVPGDMEIVMIPGNHDAVRLAEPQPGFTEELRSIMNAHDARIASNPSVVSIEGVSVLMYHGVSLDEVIAELPSEKASYDHPHWAMAQLLKKRHVAPQYGGHTRLAPESRDYLVMDEVPDVFHTGHVHKLGYGKYRNVLSVNSACWQDQTPFQQRVNIDPDVGYAPIIDLDTLNLTIQKFA